MYKLHKDPEGKKISVIQKGENTWFPFAVDNTDFIEFKRQILADEAQLQDADGDTMTAAEAKAFVATLP
jgi:hypothetical protein